MASYALKDHTATGPINWVWERLYLTTFSMNMILYDAIECWPIKMMKVDQSVLHLTKLNHMVRSLSNATMGTYVLIATMINQNSLYFVIEELMPKAKGTVPKGRIYVIYWIYHLEEHEWNELVSEMHG
jgi:hypothetical protein